MMKSPRCGFPTFATPPLMKHLLSVALHQLARQLGALIDGVVPVSVLIGGDHIANAIGMKAYSPELEEFRSFCGDHSMGIEEPEQSVFVFLRSGAGKEIVHLCGGQIDVENSPPPGALRGLVVLAGRKTYVLEEMVFEIESRIAVIAGPH